MTWYWLSGGWVFVIWLFAHTALHLRFRDTGSHLHISWRRPSWFGFLWWLAGRERIKTAAEIRAIEIECGVIDPDPGERRPYNPADPQSDGWTTQRARADLEKYAKPVSLIRPKQPEPLEPAMPKVWEHMTNQELAVMSVKDFAALMKEVSPRGRGIFG